MYCFLSGRSNQTVLIDTLEQENAKFKECTAHEDLTSMVSSRF